MTLQDESDKTKKADQRHKGAAGGKYRHCVRSESLCRLSTGERINGYSDGVDVFAGLFDRVNGS